LSGANLLWANLSGANLSRANLSGANLLWANLSGVNLLEANLENANYSVSQVSTQVSWKQLSPELTLELMRHDAESCEIDAMNEWANGGPCPFETKCRDFHFIENKKLWKPGKPKLRGIKLLHALAKEKKIQL
jgi:hypothetical protein